jgi:hypothetical protein
MMRLPPCWWKLKKNYYGRKLQILINIIFLLTLLGLLVVFFCSFLKKCLHIQTHSQLVSVI